MARALGATDIIAARYELVSVLGSGGMGAVWRANHLSLRSPVAVKLLAPALASTHEARERFLREARAAAALRSPHVVQILDHGVDDDVPYIVMELLEGESLADRLTRFGKLSPSETARVITHVARAIGKAHEAGIVHRDLKPANIFLVRNDDDEVAKVLDFGIAKSAPADDPLGVDVFTRTGALLGTPYYMSPEQAQGSKTVDSQSDLWAIAVIAFECLTGRRPFESDAIGALVLLICVKPAPVPSQIAPVPEGFDEWFAKGTSREPAQRFASAKVMADALRQIATRRISAAPTSGDMAFDRTMPADVSSARPALKTTGAAVVSARSTAPARSGRSVRVGGAVAFVALSAVAIVANVRLRPDPRAPSAAPAPATAASPQTTTSSAPPALAEDASAPSESIPALRASPAQAAGRGPGRPPTPARPSAAAAPTASPPPVPSVRVDLGI